MAPIDHTQDAEALPEPLDGVKLLNALCDGIDALQGHQRHTELVMFARSPLLSPPLLLDCGTPGRIAREAWGALKRDLAADSPAKRWESAGHARGRASIVRLLAADDMPVYATIPFRTVDTDDGPRIGAAIGLPDIVLGRGDPWSYLDIEDVLLWEPRENRIEIANEPEGNRIILPTSDNLGEHLKVYRDPFAFFRDWVARRIEALAQHRAGKRGWITRDGCLPGALAIGDLDRIAWRDLHVSSFVAGPGLDRTTLRKAVYRSFHVPPVTEAADGYAR